jgi:predicted RNA-binding protein with RPS1 domain
MKKILKEWRSFNKKQQNESEISKLDGSSAENLPAVPDQAADPIESMREILKEVQDMAVRLLEIDESLKNDYRSEKTTYYPGNEFKKAAKQLADAKEYGSLASALNRWIENEVSLPIVTQQVRDKYNI